MSRFLDLDRISPTKRPEGDNAGTQGWTELLFLHWTFAPEVIRPLVPASLDLDLCDGKAWVGMVPFRMSNIRSAWMPERAGLDFLETNVRTYVHHKGKPGVFFLSLEASSWLAVRVARFAWGLPYHFADMTSAAEGERMKYTSERKTGGARFAVEYSLGDVLGPSQVGTTEHFLLERYYLFLEKKGQVLRGQVHHRPYPAQRATVHAVHDELVLADGVPGGVQGMPHTVHYASGVDVEVFGPDPVT
ncbi:DUF2071 domain-containing protein [soil metagenome]